MITSETFIKKITNTKRSKLAYFVLILSIFIHIIWITRAELPSANFLGFDFKEKFLNYFDNYGPFGLFLIKAINSVYMIAILSVFELTSSPSISINSIKNLSIFRTFASKGAKYADIYYWFFPQILKRDRFKFLVVTLTLGFSRIHENFGSTLNSLYDKLFPFSSIPIIVIFLFSLLLADFAEYFWHWFVHKYFWELHEHHHSATEMTIFSGGRDNMWTILITTIPLLPLTVLSTIVINKSLEQGSWLIFTIFCGIQLLSKLFSDVAHSSIKLIFPKPFSYIFMSPSLHWIHHSNNPKHFNKNLGKIFTFPDRIFGTYLDESHLKDINGFGVGYSDYNEYGVLYCYYILPIKKLIKKYRNLFFKKSY